MRVESGVPGFDTLVAGGLPVNRLFLLTGPPGSGKTTFAAQFVTRGVELGERCLYLSMHETAKELVRGMKDYSFGFEEAFHSNQLKFLNVFDDASDQLLTQKEEGDYRTSVRNQVRRIQTYVDDHNLDRLVLDSAMLLRYYYSNETETYIKFLTGLKQADATVLIVSEMTDPTAYSDDNYLAHGVVFLHNFIDSESGGMTRGVQILKLRETDIDTNIRGLSFEEEGLVVHPKQRVSP